MSELKQICGILLIVLSSGEICLEFYAKTREVLSIHHVPKSLLYSNLTFLKTFLTLDAQGRHAEPTTSLAVHTCQSLMVVNIFAK